MIWHTLLYKVGAGKNVKFAENLHTSSSKNECMGAAGVFILQNRVGHAVQVVEEKKDDIVAMLIYRGDYTGPTSKSVQEAIVIIHE